MAEVKDVTVDFAAKTARITMKSPSTLTKQTVEAALKDTQYWLTTFELKK